MTCRISCVGILLCTLIFTACAPHSSKFFLLPDPQHLPDLSIEVAHSDLIPMGRVMQRHWQRLGRKAQLLAPGSHESSSFKTRLILEEAQMRKHVLGENIYHRDRLQLVHYALRASLRDPCAPTKIWSHTSEVESLENERLNNPLALSLEHRATESDLMERTAEQWSQLLVVTFEASSCAQHDSKGSSSTKPRV